MIGYMCGYLRYYYPCEFITAYLNNANNDDDINMGTELAKTLGITISGIKFGMSQELYSCNTNNKIIYKGLSSIKYMNETVSRELYNLRDNKYNSFIDLLIDINKTTCDSRQLDILIKLNFFSEFGHPNQLLKQVELFNKFYGKKQIKKDTVKQYPAYIFESLCDKATDKQYKFTDTLELIQKLCKHIDYPKTTPVDSLGWELEHLGYLQSIYPSVKESYYYVVDIKDNWVTLYQLCSGNMLKIKCRKQTLNNNPVGKSMIIKIIDISDEPRWYKDTNGNWQRNYDDLEPILKQYQVVKKST